MVLYILNGLHFLCCYVSKQSHKIHCKTGNLYPINAKPLDRLSSKVQTNFSENFENPRKMLLNQKLN